MTAILRLPINDDSDQKKNIAINQLAELYDRSGAGPRERLASARTYYVRTDGSDSNTGLINSASGAFLTLQKAQDNASGTIDFGGQDVTIQVGNGTYTAGVNIKPWVGGGTLTWQGDNTTPSNVVVSVSSGAVPTGNCFAIQNGALPGPVTIKGFKMTTSGTGTSCIFCFSSCSVTPGNLDFGATVSSHIFTGNGGLFNLISGYTISGGANRHLQSNAAGVIFPTGGLANAVKVPNAITFTTYAFAQEGGLVQASTSTWDNPGNVTGMRYIVSSNAVISSGGGGANFFPGTIAGSAITGGQYI